MELLTAKQVASLLNVSKSLVYRLKDEGVLPFYKVGRSAVRFIRHDVEEYLTSCQGNKESKGGARRGPPRLRSFKHLDGERLLAAWQRQGVDVSPPGERSAPPSSSSCAPSTPKQS